MQFYFIVILLISLLEYSYQFINKLNSFHTSNININRNNLNLNVFEGSDLLNPNKKDIIKEFFESNNIRNKPIIDVVNHVRSQPAFSYQTQLATSFELYATPISLHDMVITQIANYIRSDRSMVYSQVCYSTLFSSLDQTRIVHAMGWKKNTNVKITEQNFNSFRKASGLSEDGLPLEMKETTHLYIPTYSDPFDALTMFNQTIDSYPLFSFDFLTTRLVDSDTDKVVEDLLKQIVSNTDIQHDGDRYVYNSINKLVNIIISTYKTEKEFYNIRNNSKYIELLGELNKYAASGSVQDRVEKTNSSKLYKIADIYLP